ncbi:fibronectin-binding domain-containing protein [bacterium]|nr:MAG: fibronectin-binding domain-containing protein [bacterium]
MKVPFDSECLAAVAEELRAFLGGKVQGVRQPNDTDVLIALYANGGEAWFLLSASPEFARAYLTTRRPPNSPTPSAFTATMRARLDGARLTNVETVEGERILTLTFETAKGNHRLIAELMGKHSNVMLLAPSGRVVGALKWVSRHQSVRPVISGEPYAPPPVLGKGGGSPFLAKLRAAGGGEGPWRPVLSPGNGAYPYYLTPLGLSELARGSLSIALEQHYATAIPAAEAEALRSGLLTSLNRVLLARETALFDVEQAVKAGEKAGEWQRQGDLILAYGPSAPHGASEIAAWDYEGNEITLRLDPELTWKENAGRYFRRAKKAKARLDELREQAERLGAERDRVAQAVERVEEATDLPELARLRDEARDNRWLLSAPALSNKPEERPYEGKRIRELLAPGGWTVLYGENAEANDYLTLRVARPNDYWLHVRGATGSHVVVQTRNSPEKVQRETLEFAAKVAVRNSTSKHSRYVPVDYTLKKYVRKPKGSPMGSAAYTHEKTLHIDGE